MPWKNDAACSFSPGGKLLPKLWLRKRWREASWEPAPPACFGPQLLVHISFALFPYMFTSSFLYCMGVSSGVCSVFCRPGNDFQMSDGSPGGSSAEADWGANQLPENRELLLSMNICVSDRCLHTEASFLPPSSVTLQEKTVSSLDMNKESAAVSTSLQRCHSLLSVFLLQWTPLTCGLNATVTLRYVCF